MYICLLHKQKLRRFPMTNREQEILHLIRQNPLISQRELAEELGITRSSAAVHITNLTKKGYIKGKGYLVREAPYVCIIGGANIDIQGFPKDSLILKDSNPGQVKLSLGGVGRNIAENLVKLGIETKLVSVIGGDLYGSKILEEAKQVGLDMEHTLILRDQRTSTYLSVLDEQGDMLAAIADMEIANRLTVDYIKEKRHVIENAQICIIDTNIPKEVIEFIVSNYKQTTYFIDTVSTTKASKVKDIIGAFHTIKPNHLEAEILTGIKIQGMKDVKKAAERFLEKGVKQVFITMGSKGVYYYNGIVGEHIKASEVKVVNTTGAGDAFTAALAYGYLKDLEIETTAKMAVAAAILALSHVDTINPTMSIDKINEKIKEIKLC